MSQIQRSKKLKRTEPKPIGRIAILNVQPTSEAGRWPTKAIPGEVVPISATVFLEGHNIVAATAVLHSPSGRQITSRMTLGTPGLDDFQGLVVPDEIGEWGLAVEAWQDSLGTWYHDAQIKFEAGIDVELMLQEGSLLLARAAKQKGLSKEIKVSYQELADSLADLQLSPFKRFALVSNTEVQELFHNYPLRDLLTSSNIYPLRVDRPLASFSAWYEMFPRSEGAYYDPEAQKWVSGTFKEASKRLANIANMGFDIVYLTPIHPIGQSNRKGRNNSLNAEPNDPGSPYAIGSKDGGHDAIHPDLGTISDFKNFVAQAKELGLEVALDFALQASPDHPWAKEHPEWFTTRADGSIAYAENPPKKYQDIYPINFDNDPKGLYNEIFRILQYWISLGVSVFRVDNPHTKPINFWQKILHEIRQTNPEVIFLSEAFTKPAMMQTLAQVGFHQSYSYFTWRNSKEEIETYLQEITGPQAAVLRPNFWPTTHDILPPYLQDGGLPAFRTRAILAATASPNWGIYSGYEFVENVARPGAEEQIDNEKYEYKPRDWSKADEHGLQTLFTKLNKVRKNSAALQQLRNLRIHHTSDPAILAYSSHLAAEHSLNGESDTVITILNLDPHNQRKALVWIDLKSLGLPDQILVEDELSGTKYLWSNEVYVELDPQHTYAHVVKVRPS